MHTRTVPGNEPRRLKQLVNSSVQPASRCSGVPALLSRMSSWWARTYLHAVSACTRV